MGDLGELLTTNCHLQVQEKNKWQTPLQDMIPEEQLDSACHSVLRHQKQYPEKNQPETPEYHILKLSPKFSQSKLEDTHPVLSDIILVPWKSLHL